MEKEKPDLVRLINRGLMYEQMIEVKEKNLAELKALKETANSGKFKLK